MTVDGLWNVFMSLEKHIFQKKARGTSETFRLVACAMLHGCCVLIEQKGFHGHGETAVRLCNYNEGSLRWVPLRFMFSCKDKGLGLRQSGSASGLP